MNMTENCIGQLISKSRIGEGTWEIVFRLDKIIAFIPGQFVSCQISPQSFRSYSIVDLWDGILSLIVKGSVGGETEKWIETLTTGDQTNIRIGLGRLKTIKNSRPKMFIATGTGVAPFIPMIKEILSETNTQIKLIIGISTKMDMYALRYFEQLLLDHKNFSLRFCISKLPLPKNLKNYEVQNSRVTDYISTFDQDYTEFDWYLCGNPNMIDEVKQFLKTKQVQTMYTEKFLSLR
jgi:all-trans-retinol 13,14-reductase